MADPHIGQFPETLSAFGASTFVGPLQYGTAAIRHLSSLISEVREIMVGICVPPPTNAFVDVAQKAISNRFMHCSQEAGQDRIEVEDILRK